MSESDVDSVYYRAGQRVFLLSNRPGSMERILIEERRLAILRCLWKIPGHCANEEVLGTYLRLVALYAGVSATRAALEHLESVAAIRTRLHDTLIIAELTRRGAEAAEGFTQLDGVPKPGPECAY